MFRIEGWGHVCRGVCLALLDLLCFLLLWIMCVVSHMKCEVGHIWCVCVFQTLQEVSSLHEASYTEAQAEYKQNKNRFPDKLPSEYAFVYILPLQMAYSTQLRKPYTSCCMLVYMCLCIAEGTQWLFTTAASPFARVSIVQWPL